MITIEFSTLRRLLQSIRKTASILLLFSLISVNIWISGESFTNNESINGFSLNQSTDSTDIVEIGQFDNNYGGTAVNVVVENNIAYVANDEEGLMILDVEDPTNPILLSQYTNGSGYAWDIWVENDLVFLADHLDGLEIIDVSDTSNPIKIGSFYDGSAALCVEVRNDLAFVADFLDGLEILDVSDPTNPVEIGQFNDTRAEEVFLFGDIAYITTRYGYASIDISDPTNPTLISEIDVFTVVWDICRLGDIVYFVDEAEGIVLYNESDIYDPQEITVWNDDGGPRGINVTNDLIFVSERDNGLLILNGSDPNSLTLIGSYDDGGEGSGLFLKDDLIYFADFKDSLEIIDVTVPETPNEIGQFENVGYSIAVETVDDMAFVADYDAGLEIIDISDRTNPELIGSYCDNNGLAYDIAIQGDSAYLADFDDGLEIIDISNPISPQRIGHYNKEQSIIYGLHVENNLVYTAGLNDTFEILDISNPLDIQQISSYAEPGNVSARDVFIQNDYAFLACFEAGLIILDISDINNPIKINQFINGTGICVDIVLTDEYLFLVDWSDGIEILDYTEITNLVTVGTIPYFTRAISADISENLIVVADLYRGISVYDISDISIPQFRGFYFANGDACDVLFYNDYVFAAYGQENLIILQFVQSTTDVSIPLIYYISLFSLFLVMFNKKRKYENKK
ncbi:MAG: hypothetical protein KAX09_02565 [Candidatus Heimdallarchaeota archaeon]|nr:hypothetical protein [Candidatus Heimdallarchaeota archaeon]MCK4289842.1 hypothetical protein [Candidatus Heimdallarchaeota archaeon]